MDEKQHNSLHVGDAVLHTRSGEVYTVTTRSPWSEHRQPVVTVTRTVLIDNPSEWEFYTGRGSEAIATILLPNNKAALLSDDPEIARAAAERLIEYAEAERGRG